MNAMGHGVPNLIGTDMRGVTEKITKLIPDYMTMGDKGMADMGQMEMPLPDNTLPMMTGTGPFGPMEMGGMFSVVKVRDDIKTGDYKDPGWYRHPPGTVAREFTGQVDAAPQSTRPTADPKTLNLRKPSGHAGHH